MFCGNDLRRKTNVSSTHPKHELGRFEPYRVHLEPQGLTSNSHLTKVACQRLCQRSMALIGGHLRVIRSAPVATFFPETRSCIITFPKPFYRKSRDTWYVQIDGRQINLGKDRETAFQRYHAIMAAPPDVRPDSCNGHRRRAETDRTLRSLSRLGQAAPRTGYVRLVSVSAPAICRSISGSHHRPTAPLSCAGMGRQLPGSQPDHHSQLHAVRQTMHQMGTDAGVYRHQSHPAHQHSVVDTQRRLLTPEAVRSIAVGQPRRQVFATCWKSPTKPDADLRNRSVSKFGTSI